MSSGRDESTVTLPDGKDQKPSTSSTPTVVVISNAEPQSVIAGLQVNSNVVPSAPEESDIIHTTELKKEHWATILWVMAKSPRTLLTLYLQQGFRRS